MNNRFISIMDSIFTTAELKEILSNYSIGHFKKFGKIKKDDVVSFGQIIETTKGKLFMKVSRYFNEGVSQGLKVADILHKKKFPVCKIFKTKSKKLYLNYRNKIIVLFEFIPNLKNNWKNLNPKEINDFSKTIAKFHKLTKTIKIKPVSSGTYENINSLIHNVFLKRKRFSLKIQNVLVFMEKEIKKINCPKNQYSTGFYSEFNPGHVIFRNNKVKYVIDWEIGKTNAFFDYGSSMIASFSPDGKIFYPKKLKEYIYAYNKERLLSAWEKNHLFDAFKFGILKYGIWGFIDLKTGELFEKERNIDRCGLNKIKFLMTLDAVSFNNIHK